MRRNKLAEFGCFLISAAMGIGLMFLILGMWEREEPPKAPEVLMEQPFFCETEEEPKPEMMRQAVPEIISLGEYKLTAYCPCKKCCGKEDGITATGVRAEEGRTIAVDPEVIPYGSTVWIAGEEYTAEDCGGAIKGKRIDVYHESHEDALEFGVQFVSVFLERGTNL